MADQPRQSKDLAVAIAEAQDFNDEPTIALSAVQSILDLGPEQRSPEVGQLLLDIRCALQRCAWHASGALNYGARHNGSGLPGTLKETIGAD